MFDDQIHSGEWLVVFLAGRNNETYRSYNYPLYNLIKEWAHAL